MSGNRVSNKLNSVVLIGAVFILTLPCTGWLLVGIYGRAIQVPREKAEFEAQEASILAALEAYQNANGKFPEHLSNLAPDYLSNLTLDGSDWSFRYRIGENNGYFLISYMPSRWYGWPTQKDCYANSVGEQYCSYHYVCNISKGGYWTQPVPLEELQHKNFRVRRTNPCLSGE